MHEDELRPRVAGTLEQLEVGRDPGDHRVDLLAAGDLEPVGTVVGEAPGLEELVEVGQDLGDARQSLKSLR